ncbi:MAG TPA: prepilin-type N-terminal cleavage/methylation domain-containing protein [Gammaproteobacteria bacterium]
MRHPPPAHESRSHGIHAARGVTLIELVVVITISAIIATILGVIIVRPIQGYQAQVRRAELVDAAEMSLRRMGREIRQALPNSVRVRDSLGNVDSVNCSTTGVTCSLEILRTVDGARYRVGPGNLGHNHGPTQYRLQIPGSDNNGFNVVGFFPNIAIPFVSAAQIPPARLAIYNQAANGPNSAYADAVLPIGPYVITNPANTSFTIDNDDFLPTPDEHHITLNSGDFNFRWASPNQRFFIVDTPVSYVCNAGANGNLTRYTNYPITAAQPVTPAGGSSATLSAPVTACSFSYSAGSNERTGLVSLSLTLTDAVSGEQVNLLYQMHVDNFP